MIVPRHRRQPVLSFIRLSIDSYTAELHKQINGKLEKHLLLQFNIVDEEMPPPPPPLLLPLAVLVPTIWPTLIPSSLLIMFCVKLNEWHLSAIFGTEYRIQTRQLGGKLAY